MRTGHMVSYLIFCFIKISECSTPSLLFHVPATNAEVYSYMAISNDESTLYISIQSQGLIIYNVNNSWYGVTPTKLTTYSDAQVGGYMGIALSSDGNTAYICDNGWQKGLVILDITGTTTGASPTLINHFNDAGQAGGYHEIVISGNTAFISDSGGAKGIIIMDLTNTNTGSDPTVLSRNCYTGIDASPTYQGVGKSGNTVFASNFNPGGGVITWDISTSLSPPTYLTTLQGNSNSECCIQYWNFEFTSDGKYAFITDRQNNEGIAVINVQNPSAPSFVQQYNDGQTYNYQDLRLSHSENILYIIDNGGNRGLTVLNVYPVISSASMPTLITHVNFANAENGEGIALSRYGSIIYVTGQSPGAGLSVYLTLVCLTSTDCYNPSYPVCYTGVCGCASTSDCSSALPHCYNSECVGCTSNAECTSNSAPKCTLYNCVGCSSNADCTYQGSLNTCTNGECTYPSGCTSSNCESQVEAAQSLATVTTGTVATTYAVSLVAVAANPALFGNVFQKAQSFYYLVLINANLPTNLKDFLNAFSTGTFKYLGFFTLYQSEDLLESPATFSNQGMNSLFLSNFSASLFLIVCWLPLLGGIFSLQNKSQNFSPKLLKIYQKLYGALIWSGTITIINMNLFNLMLFGAVQMRYPIFQTGDQSISYFLALIILCLCIGFIYWNFRTLKRYSGHKEYMESRYHPFIDNIKLEDRKKYITMVISLRFLFVSIALGLLQDVPYFQLTMIVLANGSVLLFHIIFRPYESLLGKFQAFFDEGILFSVCSICFAFIPTASEGGLTYNSSVTLGTVVMILIIANTLFNLVFGVLKGIQTIRDFCKRLGAPNIQIVPEPEPEEVARTPAKTPQKQSTASFSDSEISKLKAPTNKIALYDDILMLQENSTRSMANKVPEKGLPKKIQLFHQLIKEPTPFKWGPQELENSRFAPPVNLAVPKISIIEDTIFNSITTEGNSYRKPRARDKLIKENESSHQIEQSEYDNTLSTQRQPLNDIQIEDVSISDFTRPTSEMSLIKNGSSVSNSPISPNTPNN